MNSLDFLIPAYEEPHTIGPLIQSILEETIHCVEKRILIATGDHRETEKVTETLQKAHPETIIHLRDVASKGKTRALNALLKKSQSSVIIFIDADIKVKKGAFTALYKDLTEQPKLAASVANTMPYEESLRFPLNYFVRIYKERVSMRIKQFSYINGRFFAIRRKFLPEKLPTNVMDEDRYLSLILPYEGIHMNPETSAFFHYFNSLKDYCVFQWRGGYTKKQLEVFYPSLLDARRKLLDESKVVKLDDTTVEVEKHLKESLNWQERMMLVFERWLATVCDYIGWLHATLDHKFRNPRFWDNKRPSMDSTKREFTNTL